MDSAVAVKGSTFALMSKISTFLVQRKKKSVLVENKIAVEKQLYCFFNGKNVFLFEYTSEPVAAFGAIRNGSVLSLHLLRVWIPKEVRVFVVAGSVLQPLANAAARKR